jgi:nicotinamide mononucleotide transporter
MAAAWALATFLGTQLNGAYPGLDAFITAFSLAATWMMARKYLENWLYWVVGDAVAVYLNWRIGYDAYAVLNVIYIILSIAGLVKWMRGMNAVK